MDNNNNVTNKEKPLGMEKHGRFVELRFGIYYKIILRIRRKQVCKVPC